MAEEAQASLKARALRLLSRREHSRAELARKLAPHAASREALERLLLQLEEKKQLSDERFAESRAHALARKYGPAMIRRDLAAKGIAPALIARLSHAPELERASAILGRKYRGAAATPTERARRARFLESRGFSYEIIRRLLSAGED